MITLKEIAEKSGVSIATVSNILNGKSNFSSETRDKIMKIVKETGYKPNYMARTLRAHKTNTIGLIIDDITDFSSPELIDGLMGFCENEGYKIVLENIRYYSKSLNLWESEKEFSDAVDQAIQEMVAIKVDGIIYVASHSRNMDCIPKDLDIPVIISYAYSDTNIPSVLFNDEKAAFDMTEYLIGKGHKNIAVVMGVEDSIHTQRRYKGYEAAMKKHNLPMQKNLLYYGNWDVDSGYSVCNQLLDTKQNFSAVFSFNDSMAYGVYKSLREHNLEPGKDISVVGFDDREVCKFVSPELTTMKIPLRNLGRKSGELLINLINQKPLDSNVVELECQLIERDSVTNI